MADEPAVKRAIAVFDGQNLSRHAEDAFGHHHPNHDPKKLFDAVCADKRRVNHGVRFYTATHAHCPMRHGYRTNRLLLMRRAGIIVESRPIRYPAHDVGLADGTAETRYVPQETGVDPRSGPDVVRLTGVRQVDVAVIVGQDQDLAGVVSEVKESARHQQVDQGRLRIPRRSRGHGPTRGQRQRRGVAPDGSAIPRCLPGRAGRPAREIELTHYRRAGQVDQCLHRFLRGTRRAGPARKCTVAPVAAHRIGRRYFRESGENACLA